MNRRLTIRGSILVLELAIVLPLLAVIAYVHHASFDHSVRQAQDSSLALAKLAAATLEQQIVRYHAIVRGISERPRMRAASAASCDPIFDEFTALYPHFNSLILVDASGTILCSATRNGTSPGSEYPFGDWLRQALEGRSPVVGPAFSGASGSVIAIGAPVLDEHGRPVAAVAIVTDLSRQTRPGRLVLPDQGVLTMIDPTGTVLARTREPERFEGRSGREAEIVRIALAEDEGAVSARGLDGVSRLYGFTTVPHLGWRVYAGIPSDLVLGEARDRSLRSLLISGFVLLLVTLVALYANRSIRLQLAGIGATAHALASGRSEARFEAGGPREVVRLAADLNRMLTVEERARRELAEGLERHRRLIDSAADGIFVYELDAQGRPRRFLEANESGCRMLDCPRAELVRRNPAEFEERSDESGEAPGWEAAGVRETTMRTRRGRAFPVEIHAQPFEVDGRRTLIAVVRDVTAKRRLEEEKRDRETRQRREEVDSAIAALSIALVHDLRSPLFGISATLEALEARAGAGDPAEALAQLRQSTARIDMALRNLVDWARPPALERAPCSIAELVDAAVQRAEPRARAADIAIETEAPAGLPALSADRRRLTDAIAHLLENAIQNAPRGSEVRIATRRILHRGRAWIECDVLDAGPGFRPEDLARAFQPLYSRSSERPGFGLTVAKQIVERHGGEIEIGNRPEGGARSTIRIPAAENAA